MIPLKKNYNNNEFHSEDKGPYLKEQCVFSPHYRNKFYLNHAIQFMKKNPSVFASVYKSSSCSFNSFKKYLNNLDYKKKLD